MRIFVAINFDKYTKRNILAVQERLKAISGGSYTHPENFHLTLVFIGEVEKEQMEALKHALFKVSVPKLTLEFDRTGFFSKGGGDIWWIGIKENETLNRLQCDVYDAIKAAGLPLQSNSFKPHLTLARRVKLHRKPQQNELLPEPFTANTDSISLMLSSRIEGRLTYTELENFSSAK